MSEPQTIENRVVVELNRDKEIERKEAEIKDLESKLTNIAAKEWKERSEAIADTLNIDPSEVTFENFSAYKELAEKKNNENRFDPQKAPRGGTTAPLNEFYDEHKIGNVENIDEIPLSMCTFEDEGTAIRTIAERAKKGDKESIEAQNQLVKKMGHNWEIEFSGNDTKVLFKDYKPITDDLPDDEKRRRKNFNKELADKKANWKQIR